MQDLLKWDIVIDSITVGSFCGMLVFCQLDKRKRRFAKGTFALLMVCGIIHAALDAAGCIFELSGAPRWMLYAIMVIYTVSGMCSFAAFNNFLFEVIKPQEKAYKLYRRVYQYSLILFMIIAAVMIPIGAILEFNDYGIIYKGPLILVLHLYSIVGAIIDYLLVLSASIPHKTKFAFAFYSLVPLVFESLLLIYMNAFAFSVVSLLITTPILFFSIYISDNSELLTVMEDNNG